MSINKHGRGRVKSSQSKRTKFRISIQEDDTADGTTIMTGSDTVGITVAYPTGGSTISYPWSSSNAGSLGLNANKELIVSSEPISFPFAAFGDSFEIESIVNIDDPASATAIVMVGDGEAWELMGIVR
ncbi:hypothetical protein AOQ84DRAFT_368779 [Glonium stellatum]|uniref:Uncharacterized protein n=1 Tax=Glonium stellatum TaxID=574774 RepID=A0A8E2EQV4_9PEZI|nr:hypothetical protein AOQ84DRAFT_368779 [Glonium stellatum]